MLVVGTAFAGVLACGMAWLRWGALGLLTAFSATWLTELAIIWLAYRIHRTRETLEDIASTEREATYPPPPLTSAGVGTVGRPSPHRLIKKAVPPSHSS